MQKRWFYVASIILMIFPFYYVETQLIMNFLTTFIQHHKLSPQPKKPFHSNKKQLAPSSKF